MRRRPPVENPQPGARGPEARPRIKVAHIITQLELGGAQQNTLYTCSHLDPSRYDVVLITGKGGLLDPQAVSSSYRTYFIDSLVRSIHPLTDLCAIREIARVLRLERPDILHTHSSKAGVLGRIAAFLCRVPIRIHTFHGYGFHDGQNPLLRFLLTLAEALAAAVSTRLVFVSQANREQAKHIGLGDPATHILIRSGVRMADYPAKVDRMKKKAELGLGMHKPLVVSIGNLKPQKRPEDFIKLSN